MNLSKKTDYGIRALIYLAGYYNHKLVKAKDISEGEKISEKFLEQILVILTKNNVIKSYRGNQGGYMLSRPPEKIKLDEVILALEGDIDLMGCFSYHEKEISSFNNIKDKKEECNLISHCPFKNILEEIRHSILKTAEKYSLKDILSKKEEYMKIESVNYQI